ncbi:MAG: FAD-dependent oxidoreductase [Spirochaetales bacterium]|nr:FAD-dependent oxidoreductase [Spirochaetales bacterium]
MATVHPEVPAISVGMGTCGIGNGADTLYDALVDAATGKNIIIKKAGCFGYCALEPLLMVYHPDRPVLLFGDVKASQAADFVRAASDEAAYAALAPRALCKLSSWDFRTAAITFGEGFPDVPEWNELPFFKGQEKLVMRDCGLIDPESLDEYVAVGGYSALARAIGSMSPDEVIAEITSAGLRGRGGAGFPTGVKWQMMRQNEATERYIICNADEGDPGAYMNRNEIESDPHMLVEGMAIGAYAMGASTAIVYVRAEYPLAVHRLQKAIADATEAGLLGDRVLGTDFSLTMRIVSGAGAFVCGEETALIASIEGRAGRSSPRPPFPAAKGYLGKPTNINNVETWCNVPVILARGASYFRRFGTDRSPGTKVFSLVGKVKNTGLVELPLGMPLSDIVYGMGEGTGSRKRIKAVQTGGPSGGCIPADKFDTRVDYEALAELGAIMGSGGMVVMDEDNCMVDVARYFVGFTSAESCGACAPCREGLSQMLRILTAITRGEARAGDIATLERLSRVVRDSSLCGLGQTAANPVLTTLRYFRDEYENHIIGGRCAAGTCEALFSALCENSCPLHMNIPGYLALMGEGRLEEAFELSLRDNPLPGVMGRICHFHCQMRCKRETLDEPVAQGELHRYLADTIYKIGAQKAVWARLVDEKLPSNGLKVAIIGAGPAGLSAGFYLARLGYEVTIFESRPAAGGILRYGIPAYRLPKEVLDTELELWTLLGVTFVFNTAVGVDVSVDALSSRHDALIVASGAHADRSLGVPGEELDGVHAGYAWLEEFALGTAPVPRKRALVIGGGNVAIDTARTLARLDCEVRVAYRRSRDDMPANAVEIKGAEDEGVRFEYSLQPLEVLGTAGRVVGARFRVMRAGGVDASGRPAPVATDQTVDIPCDDVYVAVGERVDASFLSGTGVSVHTDGRIRRDALTCKASDSIWAIGDAVTGPATAAEAMGLGKQAARAIDEALMKRSVFASLFKDFGYSMQVPPEPVEALAMRSPEVPPSQRRGCFAEISQGYSGNQAVAEASRCLRCDIRANARSPWR